MQQSQENNRRLLREALPNLAPGYGDAAHDKAAERLARDMDPGFTPGPWRATSTYGEDTKEPWMVWSDAKSAGIAHIYARSEMGAESGREQAANARLIAASPELFGVSTDLHMNVNSLHATMRATSTEYRGSALCRAMDALIRKNAAALARAKGGAA